MGHGQTQTDTDRLVGDEDVVRVDFGRGEHKYVDPISCP
jgi:hypothetical protein